MVSFITLIHLQYSAGLSPITQQGVILSESLTTKKHLVLSDLNNQTYIIGN